MNSMAILEFDWVIIRFGHKFLFVKEYNSNWSYREGKLEATNAALNRCSNISLQFKFSFCLSAKNWRLYKIKYFHYNYSNLALASFTHNILNRDNFW